MEIVIGNKKRNELFKREEIIAVINTDKTPSFDEAKKAIAENLKVSAEVVKVLKISGGFGRKEFSIPACVYDSKEAMEKIESKKKAKKEKAEKEKPTEEKSEQKPTQEKPTEKLKETKEIKEEKQVEKQEKAQTEQK